MIINLHNFKTLVTMQRDLDAAIAKEKNIDLPVHPNWIELAYRIEIAETVNEMKGDVKYWSDKPARRPEFLEEYVDALHFILSYSYQSADRDYRNYQYKEGEDRIDYVYRQIAEESKLKAMDEVEIYKVKRELWEFAFDALTAKNIYTSFIYLTFIARCYGITEDEVLDAFTTKHAINYERSKSGY